MKVTAGWITAFAASVVTLPLAAPDLEPVRETNLLVFPNQSKGTAGKSPLVSEIRASVGNLELAALSITSATGSCKVKTVVVFNLASVAPDHQPCLIQQARALAPVLRRFPNVAVLLFRMNGQSFISLSETGRPELINTSCRTRMGRSRMIASRRLYRGGSSGGRGGGAPTGARVIGWVHPVYDGNLIQYDAVMAGKGYEEPSYTPNSAYGWLVAFTRAGD
jgi:hypothetical protein